MMGTMVKPLAATACACMLLFANNADAGTAAQRPEEPIPLPVVGCEALAALVLPDTTITLAQSLPAGTNASPVGSVGRALCRVAGTVAPAIRFEVWMPATGDWNGRYLGYGGGGLSGFISYSDLRKGLGEGYAVASTDTGHVDGDTTWFTNTQQEIDNGHRGIHEMTVKAQAIVQAYYGTRARYSYFSGCSSGGGQAMMEAWRYPQDYDGIVAGDPNWRPTRNRSGSHIFAWTLTHKDPAAYMPAAKISMIGDAVLAQCDALDGVQDGVIENPRQCRFDPASLQCKTGQDTATCLTTAQVGAVKQLYEGARFPSTGEQIYQGYPYGAEYNWGGRLLGATPSAAGYDFFRYAVLRDPSFDFRNFDFDVHTRLGDELYGEMLNVGNVDMRAYARRGGKLLMYHGWADGAIQAYNTTDYYDDMVDFFASPQRHGQARKGDHDNDGLQRVQQFARLFMVPGMGHCGGGAGTDNFDGLGTLRQWVERGQAPDRIVASHLTSGVVDKTRPLCLYPKVAVYTGQGSTNDAANFVCRTPAPHPHPTSR